MTRWSASCTPAGTAAFTPSSSTPSSTPPTSGAASRAPSSTSSSSRSRRPAASGCTSTTNLTWWRSTKTRAAFTQPLQAFSTSRARPHSRLIEAQTAEIGALYWGSYPAGEAGACEAESVADIAASFAGAYGTLLDAASLGAFVDGRLAAVVLTVRRLIWPDTPDGPFVIELFTSPERRRSHLAANLLQHVLIAAAAAGETTVGLRVRSDNTPALALYRSQGFDLFAPRSPLDE